jgi:hypothetical protein
MRRLLVAVVLAAALPPAAAQAAAVQTDRRCYLQTAKTTVTVTGQGFAPASPYTVALDGATVPGGTSTIDANGAMQGAIKPPALGGKRQERRFTVTVNADQSVSRVFTVTRFSASFAPLRAISPLSRVRFSVYGFGLGGDAPAIYLHYVAPDGRLRTTLRLGHGRGQCGSIPRTARRRLFPFPAPARGRWKLQFDTSKRYRRGVKGSSFLFYTVGVTVRAAA